MGTRLTNMLVHRSLCGHFHFRSIDARVSDAVVQSCSASSDRSNRILPALNFVWAIPLVFALQEGGASFSWTSGAILGPLIEGVAAATIFIAWESWLGRRTLDTILLIRLFGDKVVVLVFLYVSLLSIPLIFTSLASGNFY